MESPRTVMASCINSWCRNSGPEPVELVEISDRPDWVGADGKTWSCPECGMLFTLDEDRTAWPSRLICPNHPDQNQDVTTRVYMVEQPEDIYTVTCPQCGNESQNFLRLPVTTVVHLKTGNVYLKNMLTGEVVG